MVYDDDATVIGKQISVGLLKLLSVADPGAGRQGDPNLVLTWIPLTKSWIYISSALDFVETFIRIQK